MGRIPCIGRCRAVVISKLEIDDFRREQFGGLIAAIGLPVLQSVDELGPILFAAEKPAGRRSDRGFFDAAGDAEAVAYGANIA